MFVFNYPVKIIQLKNYTKVQLCLFIQNSLYGLTPLTNSVFIYVESDFELSREFSANQIQSRDHSKHTSIIHEVVSAI